MADKTKPTKHGGARPGSGRFSKAEIEAIKRGDSDAVVARMRGRHTETVKAMREKLAAKEPPRAPAEPKADEKKPMVISPEDVLALIKATERYARERRKTPELNPFQLPQHPPLATPPKKLQMAMDESLNWASTQWAGGILGNVVAEGLLFLGYPYLAELAQRPEYRVISETIATEMTRKWIKLEGTGDEDKTDKIKELTDELDRLEIRDRFKELAIQDGFFGRSHLYLDLGVELDGSKDEELATPVGNGRDTLSRSKVQKKALRRLQCVEAVWVYPTTYNAVNPLREDWYNPQVWYVMGKQIHRSRLPTFIGHPVPDLLKPAYSFGGLSLSQMAKPYVDIWLTTRESVAALIHSFSVMVLSTDMQTVLQPNNPGGLMARVAMFNTFRDNMGTFVLNKNTEEFTNVAAPLSGLHELQSQAQEHMMSVARIPAVKFTGIQPSGLNASSEGEIRSFYDTISSYQESFFRPNLTRVIDFAMLSLWGEVDQEITFRFEPLWALSEKEEGEMEKAEAETTQIYVDLGAISPQEVRKHLVEKPESPWQGLDPEDAPDLKGEEEEGLAVRGAGGAEKAILGQGGEEETGEGGGEPPGGPRGRPGNGKDKNSALGRGRQAGDEAAPRSADPDAQWNYERRLERRAAEDADKGTRTVMLIRHGATDLNDKDVSVDRVRGWKDVPLSAGGKKEAERLGEKLMDDPPDVILTSDLKRAAETADIISMITGVPIGEKVKMFRPWDVGKWAGVKTEDALPVLADYAENKPNEPIDGGEPFTKFRDRFLAGMMAALNKYDGTIAIVTHHRNERLLRAWENAGFPSNGDIDIKTFNKEGEHTGAVIEVDVPVARLKAELEQEGGGRDASVIPFDGSVDPIFIAPATKPDLSKEKLDKIVAAASEEPPTAQELEKAKKSVALQVQYVPGHEYMPAETMQKMVDAFNKTYAGKELTSEQDLTKKVTDFKLLKAAVAEMGAKTKAEQEKVQAENAAKQQAVAAKQQAAAAEQLKKQAEVEKKKAAELHAENKEFMDSLGISEAEAEGVKGLLPSVLHLRHVDLIKNPRPDHEWGIGERADGTVDIFDESEIASKVAEMESAERAAKERGPAATAKRLEEEAAALEAEASPEPDVKDLDEEPT